MGSRIPLPSQLRGRAFTRADAAAAGLGRERLNNAELQRPFRGVRADGLDLTELRERAGAYAARMPPTHAFSHTTAAVIHGIPLPWAFERELIVHVAVPHDEVPPRMRGVTGHRADTAAAVMLNGLRVLPPLTVWCQLGTLLQPGALVASGDFLVGGRAPLFTPADLEQAVEHWSPRPGVTRLRHALTRLRVGVDSPKETELRLLLVSWGLPEPVVNRQYFDDSGQYLGRADLSWPELRITLEYEGELHRTDRGVFRRDLARRERFESAGWSVIRVTDDDLGPGRTAFERTVRARIRRQARLLGLSVAV